MRIRPSCSACCGPLLILLATTCGQSHAAGAPHASGPAGLHEGSESDSIPRLFAPGLVSTGDDESHATFSPEGTSLYFLKNTPTFDFWTIVRSRWSGGRWTTPEVAPFSGRWSDADPFLTEDGLRLYFISTRPVDGAAKEDTDLWMVERAPQGDWGAPTHLGSVVNSPASEWFPTVTRSGALYFGSERSGGKGGADIWRSRLVDGVYQAPENLGEPVNTSAGEFEPMVSPDERFMVFAAAGRPGNLGLFDLWISYNRGGAWSKPVHIGAPINSDGWDFGPRLTPDGRYLFFTSSRGAAGRRPDRSLTYQELLDRLHAPGNGLRDIYYIATSALPSAPATPPDAPAR